MRNQPLRGWAVCSRSYSQKDGALGDKLRQSDCRAQVLLLGIYSQESKGLNTFFLMHFKIWSRLMKPEKIFTWVKPKIISCGIQRDTWPLPQDTCVPPEHRDANGFQTWPSSVTARMQNGTASVEDGLAVPYELNADHITQQSHSQALTQEK